jgi:enoyl-CoA hydratase/carnithine racemase
LLDLVGYPVAYRWLATALPFGAEEAMQCGFVTRIADPPEALDAALALAESIAAVSPAVVAAVKAGLTHTVQHGTDAGRRAEPLLAALVRDLADGSEGVSSFLERRPPAYPDRPEDLHERIAQVLA